MATQGCPELIHIPGGILVTTRWVSILFLFISALAVGAVVAVPGESAPQVVAATTPQLLNSAGGAVALASCGDADATPGLEDRQVTIAEYIYLHQTRREGGGDWVHMQSRAH